MLSSQLRHQARLITVPFLGLANLAITSACPGCTPDTDYPEPCQALACAEFRPPALAAPPVSKRIFDQHPHRSKGTGRRWPLETLPWLLRVALRRIPVREDFHRGVDSLGRLR